MSQQIIAPESELASWFLRIRRTNLEVPKWKMMWFVEVTAAGRCL